MRCALALITLMWCSGCTTLPQAARIYCNTLARTENRLFLPIYPPQRNIAPNTVLELHLRHGWGTPQDRCVQFSQIAPVTTPVEGADISLPSLRTRFGVGGSIDFGFLSIRVPLARLGARKLSVSKTVRIEFEDAQKSNPIRDLRRMIVDGDGTQRLDEGVYALQDYRGRHGPTRDKPNSLWFLRVEDVYTAKIVNYRVDVTGRG